jgi:hypothetical protein
MSIETITIKEFHPIGVTLLLALERQDYVPPSTLKKTAPRKL